MFTLLFVACGKKQSADENFVPVVRVDTVKSVEGGEVLQFPGRVVATTDANLSFKVAGTLKRIYVGEGSHVRTGQLLAELDDTDYRVQLSATKAEYEQIKADAERVIALYQEGGTTASNYDKARYGLEQIEAKLQHHTNQVRYTKLYAPHDGYIQQKYFDGCETVAAGMPVVSLVGSGVPEVEVNLPASSYINRHNFVGYTCALDILPGQDLPLDLISILPQANANQLYTMRLRLRQANRQVAPGMSAWVGIQVVDSASTSVRLPATALVEENGQTFIFVYDQREKNVIRQTVNINKLHTDGTAEVSGCVRMGDLVVSAGAHHIHDGQSVRLLQPTSPTNIGGLL